MVTTRHERRRRFLFCSICLAAAVGAYLAGPLKAAIPSTQQIAFAVFRAGEPLGHHKVVFRRESDELQVEIEIDLEVKFAFITVFRYRHTNREVWRNGRLVAIDAQTDDDGDSYWLSGRLTETGLRVEGSSGRFIAPADIMPTSYWNPETVHRRVMLDTQHGRLIAVDVADAGRERISLAGSSVEARRYRVTGDLSLDLWYTAEGEWAKTAFMARGAEVVYARQADVAAHAQIGGGPEAE